MSDLLALTQFAVPSSLHGADAEYSIHTLSDSERLSIEDHFFSKAQKVSLDAATTAVVVPQSQTTGCDLEDFAVLIEFALGVLSLSGFQPVITVAVLNGSKCTNAIQRSYDGKQAPPNVS